MKKQKNKLAGLQRRKAFAGYLFIMPFILGFIMFMVKPMIDSFKMSFADVQLGPGTVTNVYIGLKNYYDAFRTDPDFTQYLLDELGRMALYSLGIIVFSFFVSLILNQEFKGRALVRAIFFLPVIMSSGIIIGLDSNNSLMANLANTVDSSVKNIDITAVLQEVLNTAGVGSKAFDKVFEIIENIYDVAIASGIQIIVFLSGLQTISSSMYEAADIEGCTKWESLWKITFPMISSIFLVNWVYTIVDFSMRSDNSVMNKISLELTMNLDYGFASAMSWAYFIIVTVIIGVSSFLISKGVYYYD